jgi:hypothetical protein
LHRQIRNNRRGLPTDQQFRETARQRFSGDRLSSDGKVRAAKPCLDRNLPNAGGAEQDVIGWILDCIPRRTA